MLLLLSFIPLLRRCRKNTPTPTASAEVDATAAFRRSAERFRRRLTTIASPP
jgi:hypothetical protein